MVVIGKAAGESSSIDWGFTDTKVKEFKYAWTINHLSCHSQEIGNKIESPEFTAGSTNGPSFRLVLRPCSTTDKEFVSIFLKLVDSKKPKVRVQCGFYVTSKRKEIYKKIDKRWHVMTSSCGHSEFIERKCLFDKNNGYLLNDKLTIHCKGRIVCHTVNISGKNIGNPFTVPSCTAFKNLGLIFKDEKFSDVTFVVEKRLLRGHKILLAAHSAVFAAMFEHEMVEKNENRVEIKDIDFEVFEAMFRFIYTGKVAKLNKMAARLLAAADKYQLDRLKAICENKLARILTADNAIDILIIADLHSAHQLKTLAMDFIALRAHEFVQNPEFQSLLQVYPSLGVETFQALSEKRIFETPKPMGITGEILRNFTRSLRLFNFGMEAHTWRNVAAALRRDFGALRLINI